LAARPRRKSARPPQAKVLGGAPVCLLGLNSSAAATVGVDRAKVTATSCAVYSNSSAADGLREQNSGSINASFMCSAGGVKGTGFTPQPQLDCPVTPDPLAGRQPPRVGGCRFVNATYSFGVVTLLPGVYCGGLTIKGLTVATLLPGEYIIKDGPLKVEDTAILTGVGAGFYLTGGQCLVQFRPIDHDQPDGPNRRAAGRHAVLRGSRRAGGRPQH
jgi:hypothetical protein